ncbi:MAG: alpha/beta fold hydrolase [Spirochaetales bacterium]|nr:MAG: alpha/beta fold hydrolase [Spirochaetales bacterium]
MARAIINGVGIEYQMVGDGDETVALLNGIAMTIANWKPVADRLVAAGYRVLMHDMRGQMLSDRPDAPYSLELHASDLASLLRELEIERAHIVGTSYGAEVALTFALDFPSMCVSVVSIDGVSEYDELLGAAVKAWKAAALSDPRVFYKSILPWNYSAGYLASHREWLARREDAIASLPRDWFEAFARLCDAFLAIDLTGSLNRIACPCLALVAGADILKGPVYSRIIADRVPGAIYEEIPGSGHAVVLENPEALTDSLERFLESARKK